MLKQVVVAAFLALAAAGQVLASADIDVEINGGIGPLKGSLRMPDGNARVPAVLILPGSGPTDRDCNSPIGLKTDAFKLMAAAFAEQGIATLRIDKRGVAASTAAATKEADLLFDIYVDDAVAWTKFLKQQARVDRVYIVGHSEGALVGTLAAQREAVAGFVSLAGSGFRLGDTLRRQLGAQLTGDLKEKAFAAIAELEAGRMVANSRSPAGSRRKRRHLHEPGAAAEA